MLTSATSGQQYYICESANTWVVQGDGSPTQTGDITLLIHDNANGLSITDHDISNFWINRKGLTITLTEIFCITDASTATVNVVRDDGTPADILTSDIICSTTGVASTGWNGSENVIADTNKLDFDFVSLTGSPVTVTLVASFTE